MDLVNLMYRYINKFINRNELLKELTDLDKTKYPKEEQELINKLIIDVERIIADFPNEIDEYEERRIEDIEHILNTIKKGIQNEDITSDTKKFLENHQKKLIKEKNTPSDGGKLYKELLLLMTENNLIKKYMAKMTDEDLLKLITQYIHAPFPPEITQEGFNNLVNVGIVNDQREAIWRLAFNYNEKNMDFSSIEDYFIKKKDAFYLVELICAVQKDLNIPQLITKIFDTKDEDFINKVIKQGIETQIVTKEDVERLTKLYRK